MNETNAGEASADDALQERLAGFLRPTFESRLQKHLGDGMLLEDAVLNAIAEVKAGLRSRIESLRASKPNQAASLERISEVVLAQMAAEQLNNEMGSHEEFHSDHSDPVSDSAFDHYAHDSNPALNVSSEPMTGGREASDMVEPASAMGTRPARFFPMALAFVAGIALGAVALFTAYSIGMKEMPITVGPGTIIVPPDRLAPMQAALEDWTVALKSAQKLFEEKDFGASVPDDRWRPLQSVHRDVFQAIPASSRAGSSMILRRGKEGGYKILVQGPLCNIVKATDPSMVDPVRDKPFPDFCWNFGYWDEAGAKF